jgi:putative membrane protein
VVGILAFSRILSWLLHHYFDLTMAVLTGFMAGALVKIWPWKEVLLYRLDSHGQSVAVQESPVWPFSVQDPQLLSAVLLACSAIALVLVLEWASKKIVTE